MAALHKCHKKPDCILTDIKLDDQNGKKPTKLDVSTSSSGQFVVRSKSKRVWLKKVPVQFLSFVLVFYVVGFHVYNYSLYTKYVIIKSELSNTVATVEHVINSNRYAMIELNKIQTELTKLKRYTDNWEKNVFPAVIIEKSSNVIGGSPQILSENIGLLNGLGSNGVGSNNLISGNLSIIERRKKRGTTKSNNARCHCRQKSKRFNKTKQSGWMIGAHLLGAHLQIMNTQEGVMGPWYSPIYNNEELLTIGINLIDQDRMIEIVKKGMYFIYAQVHYFTKNRTNSFSINAISVRNGQDTAIAVCSKDNMRPSDTEISCHTSSIHFLDNKDRVYIRQRDRDRKIMYHTGYTFFGLFQLASEMPPPQ